MREAVATGQAPKAFDCLSDAVLSQIITQAVIATPALTQVGGKVDVEAILAFVQGLKPRDQLEAMLGVQMFAIHCLTIKMGALAANDEHLERLDRKINLATKLARTFTAQLEALAGYRGKGRQQITVRHVTVENGAQAVIGAVTGGNAHEHDG